LQFTQHISGTQSEEVALPRVVSCVSSIVEHMSNITFLSG